MSAGMKSILISVSIGVVSTLTALYIYDMYKDMKLQDAIDNQLAPRTED
jgi:hypothetical protein